MLLIWLFLHLCLVSGLFATPLLMSWTTSIKFFDTLDTRNITSMAPITTQVIAIDYHYERGEVYFSDALGRIYRSWLRPEDRKKDPVVINEVKLCDGLAVDWINNNLYWTDTNRKSVEMSTLDGLYRRVLFNSSNGLENPRAIVTDPFKGLLFWTDWGNHPKIESSGLDGTNMKTVISSNLFWPNGLAIDVKKQTLYVLDGFLCTISSLNYDGSNTKIITKSQETIHQAFGLTFYGSELYWGSWRTRSLYSIDVSSGNIKTLLERTGWRSIIERMMGIKAVHPSLQGPAKEKSPCESAGCSHKCLTGQGLTTTCICRYGYKLHSDGKSCIEEGYLIMSWRKTIRRYSLIGGQEEPLIDGVKAAIAITYHFRKGLIFWSDVEEHRIYSAPLGQLNNKSVIATTETCDGLAVDWVHDVLYWTDTKTNTLNVALLDGSKNKVLISENLYQPRDIALDPSLGLMFWTDWGDKPKIEKAILNGSDRQVIINDNIAWPNGITLDFDQKKIYWVDGKLEIISTCSYDGSQRKIIFSSLKTSLQPFSISLFNDKIYWTDWKTQSLFKADKSDIKEAVGLANSSIVFLHPNAVRVVHSSLQKAQENPCASINCKDICIGSTPQKAHCMGEMGEEEVEEKDGNGKKKIQLTTKVFQNSFQLSLNSSELPSFVVISTRCVKRYGCTEDKRCSGETPKIHVFNNETLFNVSGLLPESLYTVIFVSTVYNENLQVSTTAKDPPETPTLKEPIIKGRNITIQWEPVDTCISKFKSYHYKLIKTETENSLPIEGTTNSTEISFVDLKPEVDYTVQIGTYDPKHFSSYSFSLEAENEDTSQCKKEELLCDGKKDCTNGADEDITICAGITNVIVYKKSRSEVYFRIQVLNATKKQLDHFTGFYSDANTSEPFKFTATPCIMWPESYCHQQSSLGSNKEYNFNISAVLKGGKVGEAFAVTAITKEEVSGPPEYIQVENLTPTSMLIQWHYPTQSNGIISSFIIHIQEVDTFNSEQCCQVFPVIEHPATTEEFLYFIETASLNPASTYAIIITAKNTYLGEPKLIHTHTPPPSMKILLPPNFNVTSLLPLTWQPSDDPPSYDVQYHTLIRSYLLLLLPSKASDEINPLKTDSLGPLQPVLESKVGEEFSVLWQKNKDEATTELQHPVHISGIIPRKEYKLAWVQVSQFKEAYGIDLITSDPFIHV